MEGRRRARQYEGRRASRSAPCAAPSGPQGGEREGQEGAKQSCPPPKKKEKNEKKRKESHLLLQKLPSDTQLITTTGPLFADLVISKNNPKVSPSSLDICNYSVNCMRGLYEVLLAWRVGDPGAALESRQQLLRGFAPAAHQAVCAARRNPRPPRPPAPPAPPAPTRVPRARPRPRRAATGGAAEGGKRGSSA